MLFSGCATYLVRANPEIAIFWDTTPQRPNFISDYPLYPATKVDIMAAQIEPRMIIPVIIDLPFSLVTDTLLFPVDFIRYKMKKRRESPAGERLKAPPEEKRTT